MHNLILKIVVLSLKNRFPLFIFLNSHLIIKISEIQLDELLGPA